MERPSAFADRHGAPLMIGEYGSVNKANPAERAKQAVWFTGQANAAGIPCF